MKNTLGIVGLLAGMMGSSGLSMQAIEAAMPKFKIPKAPKKYKQMVTSTDAEIAAWNNACHTRQVLRCQARNPSYA
jgi:hypothetical protein